jgi:hypothetical protein
MLSGLYSFTNLDNILRPDRKHHPFVIVFGLEEDIVLDNIAKCKGCGKVYYGHALRYMPDLKCSKCGSPLEILKSVSAVDEKTKNSKYPAKG